MFLIERQGVFPAIAVIGGGMQFGANDLIIFFILKARILTTGLKGGLSKKYKYFLLD